MRSALRLSGFAVSGDAETRLDAETLARVEVVVLGSAAATSLEAAGETAALALREAVRAGTGLVVLGEALADRQLAPALLQLLGATPAQREPAAREAGGLVVEVPDQSQPVVQCLTHLCLEGTRAVITGGAGTRALAQGTREEPGAAPLLWTRSEGRGLVAVLGVAAKPEAKRERALLAALAARAAQWTRRQPVTVRLPDDLPLAVLRRSPPALPAVDPVGYFRGRQIAPVMGFEGADWLVRPDREETEQPEKVLDALAIAAGATVADIGAGNGYFTLRLARRVGDKGKVLAVDVQPQMIELLQTELKRLSVANVEPILAAEDDPRLPAASVDLALLVDVYHELAKPVLVMQRLRASLREGSETSKPGRLVLVEYRGEDPTVPIKPLHRTTVAQVRAEIEPMGFRFVELKSFLPHQHILIFERR